MLGAILIVILIIIILILLRLIIIKNDQIEQLKKEVENQVGRIEQLAEIYRNISKENTDSKGLIQVLKALAEDT